MATLPNVPPILDEDRVIFLDVTSPTSVISVTFPVFGDAEDLQVIVNYVILAADEWTFTSASGTPLTQLPLPITDGVVTLVAPVSSGTIEIVGDWQARQVIQPTAPGVARREFNQTISTLIASLREVGRALRITPTFIQTDSEGDGYYDAQQHLISNVEDPVSSQDAVNLEYLEASLNSLVSSGGVTMLTSWALTGDGETTTFAITGASTTIELAYLVSVNQLLQDPSSYSIAGGEITFSVAPAAGADISVRMNSYGRAVTNISTTAQALAGTDDTTYMSPLKVAQAVAADLVAFLASSPTFTAAVQGVTAAAGDNTTKFATTGFVTAALTALLAGDPNFSTGLTATAPAAGDNSSKVPTTAWVTSEIPIITAGLGYGAIGTYIIGNVGSTDYAPGQANILGNTIAVQTTNGATAASPPASTHWTFMGAFGPYSCLFLRTL